MKTFVRSLAILSITAVCGVSIAKASTDPQQPQADDQEPQYDEQELRGPEQPQVFVNPETGEAVSVSPDGNTVTPLDKSKITIKKGKSGEENLRPWGRFGYGGWGRGWGGGGWGRGWGWRGGWGGRPWGAGYRGWGWGPRWGYRGWYGRGWYGRGLWYGRGWYGRPYYWRRWWRGSYWYPGYSCNTSYTYTPSCYCY